METGKTAPAADGKDKTEAGERNTETKSVQLPRYETVTEFLDKFQNRTDRTVETMRLLAAEESPPPRTAVLVIHGIGAQKPYATLDSFARGLMRLFGQTTPTVLWRQHEKNLNTNEKDWTQAAIRVRTSEDSIIDLYEYYWAPVITGRVSAVESLKFLFFAALSPFQYLRDNLKVIDETYGGALSARERTYFAMRTLLREFFRVFAFFLPVMAVVGGLYTLVANPLLQFFTPHKNSLAFLLAHPEVPLQPHEIASLALFVIRVLLLGMSGIFLFQEFFTRFDGKTTEQSPGLVSGTVLAIFVGLLLAPPALRHFFPHFYPMPNFAHWFIQQPLITQVEVAGGALVALSLLSLLSRIARSAWGRAVTALGNHWPLLVAAGVAVVFLCGLIQCIGLAGLRERLPRWLALPMFLNWKNVLAYAGLAAAAYIVKQFLTTAIGCLVVYLGSDALSKNYAARSQIMEECGAALTYLLTTNVPGAEGGYDEVLIAGHSLGSVIAFDALNEFAVRHYAKDKTLPPLEKIKGLLTFGCPLNKVVYFFRTRTDLRTTALTEMLYALHPFRMRTGLPPALRPAVQLPFPMPDAPPFSPRFKWINAYSPFDLISGRMQFYRADADIAVERGVTPWTAHLSYWENDDLYRLFQGLL